MAKKISTKAIEPGSIRLKGDDTVVYGYLSKITDESGYELLIVSDESGRHLCEYAAATVEILSGSVFEPEPEKVAPDVPFMAEEVTSDG